MRSLLLAACAYFLLAQSLFAGTAIIPTTTLAAETGNNTSTANSFSTQSNGNLGASNVSKAPISSLLYPGATTKIYAHFMPWFGANGHMDIGYKSADPAQVKAQVSDMLSRGISGMIVDWYGPGSYEDSTTQYVKPEAESRGGNFEFAVMEDAGAVRNCTDCTSTVIGQLTYIYNTYEGSPAYMRWNGNPVVFFFGVEDLTVDWNAVRAGVPGSPIFIFQNSGSFTRTQSGGGFAWIQPGNVTSTDPIAASYLDNFYSVAQQQPGELAFGAGYKGFNDTLAGWSADRHMDQQCGQTWLESMKEIGKYYSSSKQLPLIQLVTWNDYEEGTELESGIDNCVSINASISGSGLNWNISGNENTIDHYTVFISADGQNLMPLGDYPAGTSSLDLSQFGLAAGTYQLYVKAAGKASMLNHTSSAAAFTSTAAIATPSTPAAPTTRADFSVAASQSSVVIGSGRSAGLTINLTPQGSFNGNVGLACSGLPAGATCNFSPASVALNNAALPVNVTISTALAQAHNPFNSSSLNAVLYAVTFPAFGTVFLGLGQVLRRNRKVLVVSLAIIMVLLVCGCGAGTMGKTSSTTPTSAAAGTYAMTIVATSGSLQHSTTLTLQVQ